MEDAGRTILHKCVLHSLVDVVAYLVTWIRSREAHSNLLQIMDNNGDTPLQLAARLGDLTCLQVLLLQSTKPAQECPNLSPSSITKRQQQPNLPAKLPTSDRASNPWEEDNHNSSTEPAELREEISYPGTDSIPKPDRNNNKGQDITKTSSSTTTTTTNSLPSSTARGVGQGDAGKSKKPSNSKKYLREKIMESIHSSRDDESGVYSKEQDSRHPDLAEDNGSYRSSSSAKVKQIINSSTEQVTATYILKQQT
jgi:hypothetical protein